MRRFFIFILIFFLLRAGAFPLGVMTESRFFSSSVAYAGRHGYERGVPMASAEFGAAGERAEGIFGVQVTPEVFDLSLDFEFYPGLLEFRFDDSSVSLGLGGICHLQRQSDIASEGDLIFNTNFRFLSDTNFRFTGQLGYGFKRSEIYALYDDIGAIMDRTLVMTVSFDKRWGNLDLHFSAGSHNLYRYPLFVSPIYDLGVGYTFEGLDGNSLRLGGEFEVRFSDEFTTAPYVGGVLFRLKAGYFF